MTKTMRVRRVAATLLLCLGCVSTLAFGQVTTGTIEGRVLDPQSRPLARADVRLADADRHITRTVQTDSTGLFRVADLQPATYDVEASAVGFRVVTQSAVAVPVGSTVRVQLTMALENVNQSVVIESPAPPVLASFGLGTVVDRRRIESLPLNGRNFLQLSMLTPGVGDPVESSELASRGAVAIHANGAREEANNFLLDGVDNNDPYVNRYVAQPAVDSVQEFKVATNAYSAEYGRNAGGQINVITRRGSNDLQGFLYEYFRNRALNAANYFDDGNKQPFRRNEFGGGIGGPVSRGRTFFFASVNFLRERAGLSRLGTVPTEAQRRGDLSGLGKTIINPLTRQPFPGNVIPEASISPLARRVLGLFPAPNRSGSNNYLGQPTGITEQTQADFRVDHQFGTGRGLMVRYSDGKVHLLEPYAEGTAVTAGYGNYVDDRTWNGTVQYQHLWTSVANSVRFGANGFSRDVTTENRATDVGALWNVNWLGVPSASFGYPLVDVAGYTRVGDAYSLPILRDTRTFQVADDMSIDRGAHLFKVGGEVRSIRLDSRLDLFSRGQLSFSGALTGSGIGDLLLGLPSLGLKSQADNPIHMRTSALSGYAQDDWRLGSAVTVNMGVRYEYIAPPVDTKNGMTAFNPTTGRLVPVGTDGVSRSGISPDRNNVAPRVGATWALTPHTLVRGGYGLFYDSSMMVVNTAQYFNPPQFNLRIFFPSAQGLLTLADPFPLGRGITPPATVSALDANLHAGSMQHWNVAVQRTVDGVGTLTAAYAGSKGSSLVRSRDLNQPVPGPGDVQGRRPYRAFSNIFFTSTDGRSRYDSLQLSLDRPLMRHVAFSSSYTLSSSKDDTSAFLGTPSDKNFPQNSRRPDLEWAPSSYDTRHRLTMSYIVELPQGNLVTRNMQVEGITVVRSGQPFTPLLRFDNSNTGNTGGATAGLDRPNVSGDVSLTNPTPERWFNTAAFSVPAPFTFGNAGRNSVRGPGYATFDVALSKDMRTARGSVKVALQIFNVFNRANFDQPGSFADEPTTFGRILSAKAPRQAQLVARIGF